MPKIAPPFTSTTVKLLIYFELGLIIQAVNEVDKKLREEIVESLNKRRELVKKIEESENLTDRLSKLGEALTDAIITKRDKKCVELTSEIETTDQNLTKVIVGELPLLEDLDELIKTRVKTARSHFSPGSSELSTYVDLLEGQIDQIAIDADDIKGIEVEEKEDGEPYEEEGLEEEAIVEAAPEEEKEVEEEVPAEEKKEEIEPKAIQKKRRKKKR